MALIKINGRLRFFNCEKIEIKKISSGRWNVKADDHEFIVVGGRKSGGASNEWFLNDPRYSQWHQCDSMVKAIRWGVQS